MKNVKLLFLGILSIYALHANAQVIVNPCMQNAPFKIVVIGSSTAAGSGVSVGDSAWVNNYRNTFQDINPNVEVINLAVGGYNTYKLMPNAYVGPTNRPLADTIKNVTAALKQNPDVIIVNLPSNDRSWPMGEQLGNFDSIYNHAWANGVPIYICTTQPIFSPTWASYQRAVRDSIVMMFSPYSIDFFLPLADTANMLDSNYSNDGIHPNDVGHGLLFKQVWDKDIFNMVYDPPTFPDLAIQSMISSNSINRCADSNYTLGWIVANVGDSVGPGNIGSVKVDFNGIVDSTSIVMLNSLRSCEIDTIWTIHNFSQAGIYSIELTLSLINDSILSNNILYSSITVVEPPEIAWNNDTVCKGQDALFNVSILKGDSLFWYESVLDSIPIAAPDTIFNILSDTTLFVQAVTGSLRYGDVLETTESTNINWNGNMFNIVAKEDLSLHAIEVRVFETGNIPYFIYVKDSSYQGFENADSLWTLYQNDTINISNSGDFVRLNIPEKNLNAGDTLAIYIHLANPFRIQYQSFSAPVSYSSTELTYLSGAGINYRFGNVYPNRVMNLKLHYNYGMNYLGECATSRIPVSIGISREHLFIGNDTTITTNTYTIASPTGYTNHIWINNDNGDTISQAMSAVIDTTQRVLGNTVSISCIADDKWGCVKRDTINITFDIDNSINELTQSSQVTVYPNPTKGIVNVVFEMLPNERLEVELIDITGRLIKSRFYTKQKHINIDISDLMHGVYILNIRTQSGSGKSIKIIKN